MHNVFLERTLFEGLPDVGCKWDAPLCTEINSTINKLPTKIIQMFQDSCVVDNMDYYIDQLSILKKINIFLWLLSNPVVWSQNFYLSKKETCNIYYQLP